MLFMVVEHYTAGPDPVYERAAARGRMLPDGLEYMDSWVVDDDRMDRCFQLMRTEDPALLDVWIAKWDDLCEFQVFPVVDSATAAARVDVTWPSPDAGDHGTR
jgi:hypothetical protein